VDNEKQFENKVKSWLHQLQKEGQPIKFIKIWGGGFQKAGIPDILACVNGHFVAIELKGTNGKPSELQKYNIRRINECNGTGVILYPEQFETFKLLILDLLRR
jgi:Holliday junction resolvase